MQNIFQKLGSDDLRECESIKQGFLKEANPELELMGGEPVPDVKSGEKLSQTKGPG